MATKVIVSIPNEADYAVRIGQGILDDLGSKVAALGSFSQVLIITDSNVGSLYLAQAKASLARAGFKTSEITVPAGEETKSLEVAGEIWSAMAQLDLGRDCVVVALGGGVVGDLAGFVASTYMRGVCVVQVPTTLLSMVDSSVGGKTAVNLPEGKNLVGTFFQPSHVCADTATLSTLDQREWRCGCAEIAKSSVIDSDEFFFWMLENASALAARDAAVVAEAVARCVVFKANVVARDKTETSGVRECLNYGHTLGHAIESVAGYGVYSHGAAVAEGMRFAALVAREKLGASDDFVQTQADLLDALGLAPLDFKADPAVVLEAMKHDKKTRGGSIRFVLPVDVGEWKAVTLSDAEILAYLEQWQRFE